MDENNGSVSATLAGYVGFAFQQYELTTPQLAHYAKVAAEVCKACEDECSKHAEHPPCKGCADACKACAAECAKVAA